MPGQHYTPAEDALQMIVEIFRNLLSELKENHSTNTCRVVLLSWQLDNIDYLWLRYINTGGVPF